MKMANTDPYIEEIVLAAEEGSVKSENHFPLCLLDYRAQALINMPNSHEKTIMFSAKRGLSVKSSYSSINSKRCSKCNLLNDCNWFSDSYIKYFGDSELQPG